MPRKWQTSSASGAFAVPLKILNFSSTRTRGLRSGFSSEAGGGVGGACFSAFSVFSGGVTKVAIGSSQFSLLRSQSRGSSVLLRTENWQLRTDFLAGPLGFEPRQSAPKALDLPLVDGPVVVVDFGLLIETRASINTVIVNQ